MYLVLNLEANVSSIIVHIAKPNATPSQHCQHRGCPLVPAPNSETPLPQPGSVVLTLPFLKVGFPLLKRVTIGISKR